MTTQKADIIKTYYKGTSRELLLIQLTTTNSKGMIRKQLYYMPEFEIDAFIATSDQLYMALMSYRRVLHDEYVVMRIVNSFSIGIMCAIESITSQYKQNG